MKVRIAAGGREVEIQCDDTNVSPKDIADHALEVWKATEGAKHDSDGPAFGYQAERRPTVTTSPFASPRAPEVVR